MSRESRLTRRAPRRNPRPRLLVVCGSECTEPQYLTGLRDSLDNRAVEVAGYDKAELDFADYAGRVSDAVKRARTIDDTGTDHLRNPSTSMWRLTEKITG